MTVAKENSLEGEFEIFEPEVDFLVVVAEKAYVPNSLQAVEEYKQKVALQIRKNFIEDFHVLRDGYTFIGNYNQILKEKLRATSEIKNTLRDPVKITALLKEGKSFQQILEWSDADLIEIYALASDLLDKKYYYESAAIFRLLSLIRPHCYYFWLKAGDALDGDKRGREAIAAYYGGLCENPYCYELYHQLCHLLIRQGDKNKALAVLTEVIELVNQDETESQAEFKEKIVQLSQDISLN